MNANEIRNFVDSLNTEYYLFELECRELTGKEMFDSITEKYTKFRIYDYLLANAKYYNYKYVVKDNIINYYYDKFTKSKYELSNDDLKDFMLDEITLRKKQLNQSEM